MRKEANSPGIKFFRCKDCLHEWQMKVANCSSRDGVFCPRMDDNPHPITQGYVRPYDWESHPEWSVDKYGNII
jgi:hypothetical protein